MSSIKFKTSGKIILILLVIGGLFAAKIFWWDKNHPTQPSASSGDWGAGNDNKPAHAYYLRLAGSNTIGDSLAPALVRAYLESQQATGITIATVKKDEKEVSATLNGQKIYVQIAAHGTATGFSALDENIADVAMASAPIDDVTYQHFSSKASPEDMRAVSNEHVIGLDGISVIVNAANQVSELSLEDLRKIFTGETKDWSQVPGAGMKGKIELCRRDDNSGTFKMFKEMALNKQAIAQDAKVFEKSNELVGEVSAHPEAIGFVSYAFVKNGGNMRPVAVKAGENLQSFVPNSLSIQTEKYPLCRRLFLYTLHAGTNAAALPFVKFAESDAAQRIVESVGFVNLTINNDKPKSLTNDPPGYISLINSAKKLSVEFRFKFGSQDLDTRAVADITRLVSYLSLPENKNKQVILVGFADNIGSQAKNIELSRLRAESVAKKLAQQSISVMEVKGFGSARPVHNNDNEQERSFNRRVEVWLSN